MARRLADSIWLRPEPKGRQPSLSRSQIAGAALAIADAEGFEQVTMRRVAARLRAGTMTLYHYVRTKDDLLALVDDALMAQVLVPSAELSKGWREAISAIARKTRAVLAQHSWALVSMQLAPPGPHAMEHFEQCLAALADAEQPAQLRRLGLRRFVALRVARVGERLGAQALVLLDQLRLGREEASQRAHEVDRRGRCALQRKGGERQPRSQPLGVAKARVDHEQCEGERSKEKQPD
jgi:AcrR family transcriptional regulator